MSHIRRVLFLLCLYPLLFVPCAQAQSGKLSLAPSDHRGHGTHPNALPPIGGASIYVLDVGFPYNAQPTSLVDCTLVGNPSYPQVGGPDGNGNCFVVANGYGEFNLTGTYYSGCATDEDMLYFEGIGGTPSGSSSPNPYSALLAVPPAEWNCGYLNENGPSLYINISDLTTVATALTVGSYGNLSDTPLDGISYGSTASDLTDAQKIANYSALLNAFDTSNSIVSIETGVYSGSNTNVEYPLYTIADVIDSCIVSSNPTTDCGNLFDYTSASYEYYSFDPVNTWEAAQSMAQSPTNNVAEAYGLITSSPPWTPYLSSAPASWGIAQSVTTPTIYPLSLMTEGTTVYVSITGSNLIDETTSPFTYPTVVFCGQVAALRNTASESASQLYVSVPSGASNCTVQVYLEGDFSNIQQYPIAP